MSIYQSAADAQGLLVQAFERLLHAHLTALSVINHNNAVTAAACAMLAQAAAAPRHVAHNEQGEPVVVPS